MKRVEASEVAAAIQSLKECDAKNKDLVIDVLMQCNSALGYLYGVAMCAAMVDEDGVGRNIQRALDLYDEAKQA